MKRLITFCFLLLAILHLQICRCSAQGVGLRAINGTGTNLTMKGSSFYPGGPSGVPVTVLSNPGGHLQDWWGVSGNIGYVSDDGIAQFNTVYGLGVADFGTGGFHINSDGSLCTIAVLTVLGPLQVNSGGAGIVGTVSATAFTGDGSGLVNTVIPPIRFTIDGQGSVLAAGSNAVYFVENNLTIKRVTLLADQSGSVQLDLRRCTYAQYDAGATHPASGDSIVASAPPAISTATKSQDATLTGWTKTLSAGDVLQVRVTSATTITRCVLSIQVAPR
jgi:hypothetical protein